MVETEIWMGARFDALVEYVEGFDAAARERLADLYGAPSHEARSIARAWCERPERVLSVIDARVKSASARGLLADLVVNHDEPLELRWRDRRAARTLQAVGLASTQPGPGRRDVCVMPAALAAVLAPILGPEDIRASLILTCGRWSPERLAALADAHGVTQRSRVLTVLAIAERFSTSAAIDTILNGVPDPEWLGTALMALELGGTCYWQDLFGDDETGGKGNVVPLMRRAELRIERDIADELQRWGLLLRLEGPEPEQELAAVPEELWLPLWELGRDWISDWTAAGWEALREGATSRRDGAPATECSLVGTMKWLACEVASGQVRSDDREPVSPPSMARLAATSSLPHAEISRGMEVGLEMGLWIVERSGTWTLAEDELGALDVSRPEFARTTLARWCVGEVGARADLSVARALGLDEQWASQARALLKSRSEWFPTWMEQEGLDSMFTGTGYLRPLERADEETLRDELAYVTSYALGSKLLWLDLLGLLETGRWHLESALRELLQLVCAATLFQLTSAVLDRAGAALFLPVQRSSFLTDPQHTAAFDEWTRGWLDELAIPLGVAARSEDGERVWLDTRALRIESPEGIPDSLRVDQVRSILQDQELGLDLPRRAHNGWRPRLASTPTDDARRLSVDTDVAQLVEHARRAAVSRFDGKYIELTDSP